MRAMLLRVILIALAGAGTAAFAASLPPLPATPTNPVVDTIQGVKIADPYRWLENWDDPKVKAWGAAQNARTRAFLDALPSQGPVKAELTKLIKGTSPAYYQLTPRGAYVFAFYNDPAKQQPALVVLNAAADPASRRSVVDPNVMDAKGLTAIDWFVPSIDGKLVAVSLSQNGSENGTLHVYDVVSAHEVEAPIPRVQYGTAGGDLAWTADGKGFWYTRYPGPEAPAPEQHFNMEVFFHHLGSNADADALALGKKDGLERVSEVFLENRFGRPEILASVQRGDGGQWAHYVLSAAGRPHQVSRYDDKIVYATMGPDGALYGISRADAPNGKIVKLSAPLGSKTFADAAVIVPASGEAIVSGGAEQHVSDLALSAKQLFVRDIVGGPNDVRVFDFSGKSESRLPLPDVAGNTEVAPLASGHVLFNVLTYLRPVYFDSWDPKTGNSRETALKVTSPVDFSDAEVGRAFAVSKDGTKVPLNIVEKKGTAHNGANPLVLYGYGGFGLSQTPHFLGAMWRVWLDAGGVYVVANIRGGAEYGERWHQEGMLTKKQNVFDDFAAAGQWLIEQHYTDHAHLALMGGSNGGLLMGALITQHPELAHAVISAVGIYDMLRVELDPNGAFNVTEFGTVKDSEQFQALYAYSPYHHVVPGTNYPAVLMLTGATDPRVNPMQSRKFTAALQAASKSDLPILLRTNANSGHGIGSSLDERIAEQTDMLSFFFAELGNDWRTGLTTQ